MSVFGSNRYKTPHSFLRVSTSTFIPTYCVERKTVVLRVRSWSQTHGTSARSLRARTGRLTRKSVSLHLFRCSIVIAMRAHLTGTTVILCMCKCKTDYKYRVIQKNGTYELRRVHTFLPYFGPAVWCACHSILYASEQCIETKGFHIYVASC